MKRLAAFVVVLSTAVASAQTLDKKVLSLAGARKVAAAAETAAKAKGVDVVIVVVDDAGYPLVLQRMDGAQVASVNVGIGKARTAQVDEDIAIAGAKAFE